MNKNNNEPLKFNNLYDMIITAAKECLIFVCLQKFAVTFLCLMVQTCKSENEKFLMKEGFLTMASNSKKAAALVLTAMIAATSLVGCASGGSSGGSTASTGGSTGSTASAAGDASTGDGDASAEEVSAVDVYSEEYTKAIKDAIAAEAEAAGSNKIKLKLWCAGDDRKFELSRIEEFKKLYSDSRYEITVSAQGIGEDQAGGKIIESPQDGADVFSFADDQLSQLVEAKAIAQVADLFNANVIKNNTADSVKVCSSGNIPYAFPKTSDNGYFLYYDKRVYTDEKDLETFDKLIEVAKSKNKNVFFSMGNAWYNTGFFFTAGCTITYENEVQTATLNTNEGLSAAKAMCHIAENADNGFVGSAGQSGENAVVQQGFASGKYAAAVIGTWVAPAIKESIGAENLGAAKLPTVLMDGEQKQLQSFAGYKILGVNAFTKYPTTAQALAYFLTNGDSQLERYKTRGFIPTNNEALENEEVKSDPARQAIDAQKPFSHPQGASVGGKYWAAGIGGFGDTIVNKKGKVSDNELKTMLDDICKKFEG